MGVAPIKGIIGGTEHSMGKLVDKLREVTQASSRGMGFLGRAHTPERASRPAAVLVAGGKGDIAALTAAVEHGADGVLLLGWSAGNNGFAGLVEVLGKRGVAWGPQLDGEISADALSAAQGKGAAFAVLGQTVPASVLFEEIDRFDRVITIEPPRDDLALLSLRAVNLLPAQAALVQAQFTPGALAKLTIADFTRLRLLWESVRFPSLVTVRGGFPSASDLRILVQLGVDALVVEAAGSAAPAFGEQVKALLGELERTPARRDAEDSGSLLGGLTGSAAETPAAPEPKRRPEPEPDEQ